MPKTSLQTTTGPAPDTALARLQILELDSKRYADESLARMAHGFMEIATLPGSRKAA